MLARYTFSRPAEPVLTCATSATKQRHVAWPWTDWTDWLAQPRHPGRPGPWLSLSLTSPHLTLTPCCYCYQASHCSQARPAKVGPVSQRALRCVRPAPSRPASQPASPCSRSRAYRGGTRGSSAQVPIAQIAPGLKKGTRLGFFRVSRGDREFSQLSLSARAHMHAMVFLELLTNQRAGGTPSIPTISLRPVRGIYPWNFPCRR